MLADMFNMGRRQAIVTMPLHRWWGTRLADGCSVVAVLASPEGEDPVMLRLVVESPDLPVVPDGEQLPVAHFIDEQYEQQMIMHSTRKRIALGEEPAKQMVWRVRGCDISDDEKIGGTD